MDFIYILFGLTLLWIFLTQLNQRLSSPIIAIVNRWLRWWIFGFGMTEFIVLNGWSDRPFLILVAIFLLLWLLLETIYNWLAIQALSLSTLPLFPRFNINQSGEEWPTQRSLLQLREWLRQKGFKQVQALKAEVAPSIYMRVSIYEDATASTRLQVTFLPQANDTLSVCYSIATQTTDGLRYVTDNLYMPFGGFYPENWFVIRQPWLRSLPSLLKLHQKRLASVSAQVVPWTTDPLEDINTQQSELEKINIDLGFLTPRADREELGKITHAGCYRVWKEYWLLSYFGYALFD